MPSPKLIVETLLKAWGGVPERPIRIMDADDVIGSAHYIVLEDGATITVDADAEQVLLVIPGGGAHLLAASDAMRLATAILQVAYQCIYRER